MGEGPGSNAGGGGSLWHWIKQKFRIFSSSKIFKNGYNNQWRIHNKLKSFKKFLLFWMPRNATESIKIVAEKSMETCKILKVFMNS